VKYRIFIEIAVRKKSEGVIFMKTKHVIVEDYNPEWKNEFELIKDELLIVLSGKINYVWNHNLFKELIGNSLLCL
jgi:hypothetical protein